LQPFPKESLREIFWLLFDQAKSNKHFVELFYCSEAEINFNNSFSANPPQAGACSSCLLKAGWFFSATRKRTNPLIFFMLLIKTLLRLHTENIGAD